jgi:hypothetical protein
MRILTLGDSWTYGTNSSDPSTLSWPAQLSKKYGVDVVNLARPGSSNQRAARIGIEELCRDSNYDYVIFPLAPASRTEILNVGKWHQIWTTSGNTESRSDRLFIDFWHPWGDIQNTIHLAFYFMHSLQSFNIPLYMTGLCLYPHQYNKEISWILNYKNDNDFRSLDMPLKELNIGIKDLDRKLKSLKAIHEKNLLLQSDYLYDVVDRYFFQPEIQTKYNYSYEEFTGHPDDNGYHALCDYFAGKIGLSSNN